MSNVPNTPGYGTSPSFGAVPNHPASSAGTALEIGATLSETLRIFGRRFVPLVLLMAVILVPLSAVGFAAGYTLAANGGATSTNMVILTVITSLISIVASLLGQSAAIVAVVDDLRNRPFSIGTALSVSLRRLMPILGVTILSTLAIMLGTLLLVIPGFIVMMMFYVAVPVCVVERAGATDSLGRSRSLTKGQRWRIFAVVLIVGIVAAIVGGLITYMASVAGTIPKVIADVIWQTMTTAFGAVLTAVVYYRLRMLKDGVDISAIANVFD